MNSIIIPFFNRFDLTHKRLAELYQFAPESCEVVLVNDASTDLVDSQVGWWKQNARHTIRYRKNKVNLGFGGAHNAGSKVARGDILIFLSNDVNIYGDFITPIQEAIEVNNNVLVGARMIDFNSGWNTAVMNDGQSHTFPYLEGWLVACHRDIFIQLGGWDDRYKIDYEDMDLSTTAKYLGFGLVQLNLPVEHKHLGSTIETVYRNRLEMTNLSKAMFFAKWNKILFENEL